MTKLISIMSPCFNEEKNIYELYNRICVAIDPLVDYQFEILFIDNSSSDATVDILRGIADQDRRVKIIVNIRNFGPVRSPYWAVMQTQGVATIGLASDLQDPPEMIPQFINEWEKGWKVVYATKAISKTNLFTHACRKLYYKLLNAISEVEIIKDATGFGMYDREVLDQIRKINDPYPFFRGIICELGFPIKTIAFVQPRRLQGISSNNIYSLFDNAMLGIVSHSIVPLRVASFIGFTIGFFSILAAFFYLIQKLIYWNDFPVGFAPVIIGFFLMFGLTLIFIGIVGEYVASIHTYVQNRPIVVEKERINF